MKKNRRISLRAKTMLVVTVMALILGIAAISMSYKIYAETMDAHYKKNAVSLAYTAATQMDNERLKAYIETEQTDEQYEEMRKVLKDVQKNNDLKYIYILQLRPDVGKTFTVMDTEDSVQFGTIDELVQTMPKEKDELVYISNTETFGWLCSAMVSMKDSKGEPFAVMCVDISMDDVMADRFEFLNTTILFICLLMILLGLVIILLVGKYVVNPINQLANAASSFVSDRQNECDDVSQTTRNLSQKSAVTSAISKLAIKTGDEIESLAEAIKTMEQEINIYIDDLTAVTAEKERIGAELDVATRIQGSMLPCIFPPFPDRKELDIFATMTPAKEVGGDFYDFFLVDDEHLAMVMADVSGKGVPAALFMVIAKTLIKNSAQTGLSPREVLEKVNNQLCENNDAELFVTVWLGVLEISTGKLVAANAGHEYPVMKRAGGDYELLKDKHGFVLAGMEGLRYEEYELMLSSGDRLYLYTDGVAEATNSNNELYGTERMLAALNRCKEGSPEELLHHIKEDVDSFVGEAPQFDDITMLALELYSQEKKLKSIQIKPEIEQMEKVISFVEKTLEAYDVPMKVTTQFDIAVDEVFSNIVNYSGASDVTVECQVDADRITLRFEDNGFPYDPTLKQDPDTSLSAEEREIGGLGIYMVKKSMDSVSYEYKNSLNMLVLSKKYG